MTRTLHTPAPREGRSCSRLAAASPGSSCTSHASSEYRVVPARAHDLPLIPAVELAAARLLAGHAPPSALCETTTQFALRAAWRQGRVWVALADDVPVGFAHVVMHEPGVAHLEEVDVHPAHGRRGLGRQLVAAACTWAAEQGLRAMTLTTFRDLPWNMPFYERMGFEIIPPADLSPALRSIVEDESRRGLDAARRVVMRRSSHPKGDDAAAAHQVAPDDEGTTFFSTDAQVRIADRALLAGGGPPRFRVARPSRDLDAATHFYTHALGLDVLATFADHDGFDGVVLGHRSWPYHLEFTRRRRDPLSPRASDEDLLVFYLPERARWEELVRRIRSVGAVEVVSSNPYWRERGVTFEDPDGYRIVLENAAWP